MPSTKTKKPTKKTQKKERVDKNLVAYCGLYCGDCFGYQGTLADMARDLRKLLRQNRFDAVAGEIPFKEFKHYPECYECLGGMVKLRCKHACRGGGGNPFCKIRKCCQRKGYEGCWECDEFKTCEKLTTLNTVHKNAHIKNLKIIAKEGIPALVESRRSW